jgi:hypothetical protein
MTKKMLIILAVVMMAATACAQPGTLWTQTFGGSYWDEGYSVQQTDDGGYIVVGFTSDAGGWTDVYLIKTDVAGNEQWSETFGGSDYDYGYSVQQTDDGGYIVAGYTWSFGVAVNDVYLIKTDASGVEEWSQTFGGSGFDEGYSVQQTSDNGYIIVGYTWSGAGLNDVYLIKTDASGVEEWSHTFGGSSNDYGYSVQQTSDGGYIIVGFTMSYGSGPEAVYLIKTDASGNQQWSQTFGGSSSDRGYSVQQNDLGGYIVAGYTWSFGAGDDDVYLISTDASGNQQWSQTFGGVWCDYGRSVQQTDDGGYIVAGTTESFGAGNDDTYLIKTDASGNQQWSHTFGGSSNDFGYSVQQTGDGGYIVAGYTESYGVGGSDVWLIRIASEVGVKPQNPEQTFKFQLSSAYPNPFNPCTSIRFGLPVACIVELSVYDLSGRTVAELINGWRGAGLHEVTFDASQLASGIYVYRMQAGNFNASGKMVLLK